MFDGSSGVLPPVLIKQWLPLTSPIPVLSLTVRPSPRTPHPPMARPWNNRAKSIRKQPKKAASGIFLYIVPANPSSVFDVQAMRKWIEQHEEDKLDEFLKEPRKA